MGIIPDKFILLNQEDAETLEAVKRNLSGDETKPGLSRISDAQ